MKSTPLPVAPFFLAVYPVVTIATANAEENIDRSDLAICIMLALAIGAISLIVARKVTPRKSAQALLASLFVIFSMWYGAFVQALSSIWPGGFRSLHAGLFPFWIVMFVALGLWLRRSVREFHIVPAYMNVFTGLLLIFSVAQLARSQSSADPVQLGLPLNAVIAESPGHRRPDIYFIVLDKYTGPTSLYENYDFDMQPFIEQLTKREFYVPRSSRANYIHTHLSVASMLNWTHMDSIAMEIGIKSRDRTRTYAMIEYNRAFRYLDKLGYEFWFYPSAYSASWRNRFADRQLLRPFRGSFNVGLAVVAQSPVPALVTWICKVLSCKTAHQGFPYTPETPGQIKAKLQSLNEIAREPGPKFVFMHLLSPHEPYVFRGDCSHRPPLWPNSADPAADSLVRDGYTQQIACLNQLLLESVDGILRNSAGSPVIVLQSDHGHGRMVLDAATNEIVPLQDLDARQVIERTDIFAAYHLPFGGNDLLYDSITPVNIWPSILNFYFNAGIKPREDATYWSDSHSPFRLIRLESVRDDRPQPDPSKPGARANAQDHETSRVFSSQDSELTP